MQEAVKPKPKPKPKSQQKQEDVIIKQAVEPEHYLVMRSKISKRADRFPFALMILFSVFGISTMSMILLLIYVITGPYLIWFLLIIPTILFFTILYIVRKYYVLKDATYNRFDLFGYSCAQIGMDLERLLAVPNYNHYLIGSINGLRFNSWIIRWRHIPKGELKFKEKLKNLSKLSFNILDIVDDVDKNKKLIEDLKRYYMGIANEIYQLGPEINKHMVNEIVKLLKSIPKLTWKQRLTSLFKLGKPQFLLLDIIVAILFGVITYIATNELGWGIAVGVTALFGFPALYLVIKSLPS